MHLTGLFKFTYGSENDCRELTLFEYVSQVVSSAIMRPLCYLDQLRAFYLQFLSNNLMSCYLAVRPARSSLSSTFQFGPECSNGLNHSVCAWIGFEKQE